MRALGGELLFSPLPCRALQLGGLHRVSPSSAVESCPRRPASAGHSSSIPRLSQPARQSAPDLSARAAAGELFPFDENDYYKVKLQVVAATLGQNGNQPAISGNVVLIRNEDHMQPTSDSQVMMLSISGDAVLGLTRLMNHGAYHKERPLSMDLLWSTLQQRETVQPDFKLLRVAVVDLQSFAYIGRLFFGDPATGQHTWDCDTRPSDAFWLALRSHVQIYVKKHVWDENSQTLKALAPGAAVHSHEQADEDLSGVAAATTVRPDDPEPLKLLKMKLTLAIKEEDYVQAACIRDHPYMALHLECVRLRSAGRPQAANEAWQQLCQLIEADTARIVPSREQRAAGSQQ